MLVGDIKTKWLRFKAVLLDLVEKFCSLARSKRPLARHIIAMQKQKKKLYKNFCLHVPKSTGTAKSTMTSLTPSHCGVSGQFTNAAISNPKVLFGYIREGTKKRDPIPGLRKPDGSIETNDEENAQILANHFETVHTHESSLPEVGLPSHTENAKIEYEQVLCNDVKKTSTRPRVAFHHSF